MPLAAGREPSMADALPKVALTRRSSSGQPPSPGFSSRHADVYISELLSYSLDRLRKEPELLSEEQQLAERGIQAAAVTHYRAFVDAAQCLETVTGELQQVEGSLATLLSKAPLLTGACEEFARNSASVMEQHGANKQLLSAQPVLLELLEAPALMDTCVRNAIYDEALDIAAFVARLGLLHPDLPVVQALMAQVRDVSYAMLAQLLARLRSSIQLPECLRVIGYLRRMGAFPEPELRLHFLRCREAWLSQLVEELDDSDSYEFVKHLTDLYRLHLFDVVMQYRAIFFDSAASQDAGGAGLKEGSVLYTWLTQRMALYLAALRTHLPAVTEGANLASVLEHCLYCASSLARVGLDFSGLLQPVFELCTLRLFGSHLSLAVEAFAARLDSQRWVAMPATMLAGARAKAVAAPSSDGAEGKDAGGGEDLSPPYALMEHFPLAVLTNGLLGAMNELRHCALSSMAQPLAGLLQASLEQAASALVHYKHSRALNDAEAALFRSAVKALPEVVVPHINACFVRVFPGVETPLDAAPLLGMLAELLVE